MDSKEFFFFVSSVFIIFLISDLLLGFKWFYAGISLKENFVHSYRMIAILKDDLPKENIIEISDAIKKVDGIREVIHLKKNDVEELVSRFIDVQKMKRFIPEVLEIYIDEKIIENTAKIKIIEEKVKGIDGVEFVDAAKESVENAIRYITYVKKGGKFFALMLAIAGILVIYNFIYLTIYSIQKKIEIMKFVGAGSGFIKIPIIIRGTTAGILGSLLSFIFMKFISGAEIAPQEFFYIILYSIFAGGIGSYLAMVHKKV